MDRKKERQKLRYSEKLKNRAGVKQSRADKGVRHKNNQGKQTKQAQKTVKIQGNIRSTGTG